VYARWADPQKVRQDPRRLALMRLRGETDPTRIYAGRIPQHLSVVKVLCKPDASQRPCWAYNKTAQAVPGRDIFRLHVTSGGS
jgi:hypothetical protein